MKSTFTVPKRNLPWLREQVRKLNNKAKKLGLTLIPFPDRQKWIDAIPDIRAQWAQDMAKKGLGSQAQEMIKMWDAALTKVRAQEAKK